jgi:glycosyltransferase involved in cell wall biosynthesis
MPEKKWKHREIYAPRLRILLDPIYIQAANLGSSSTHNRWALLVKQLIDRGHYVYWMLPDKEYTLRSNNYEDHPNVGIIRTDYIQDQFVIDGLVSSDYFNLFNRIAGKYHIDIVVTGRTGAASMIKKVLESPRFHDKGKGHVYTDKHYGLPMAIIEGFPQTQENQFVGEAYWLGQCQGYLTSDCTFFLSEHNRSEITNAMAKTYTQSTIRKFVEKSRIVPTGIRPKVMDKYYNPERWKVEKQFRVISVGRLMSAGYREYLAWFDYIYKSGIDAKLIVSLSGSLGGPTAAALKKMGVEFDENNPQFQLLLNNPRDNFLKLLNTVHAGICPVHHYDSPAGPGEAIYMGVPLIIPRSDYQKTFFPDYPFVIEPSNKAQLLAFLQEIKDDPQEARNKILPWRDHLRETFDIEKNAKNMADHIEELAREPLSRFKTSGAILGFLAELKGERYTFADIVAYLRKCGRMGISIGDLGIRSTWTYGRGTIHHAMRYTGYVDLCDGPDEVFVRRDVFENMLKDKPKIIKRRKKDVDV